MSTRRKKVNTRKYSKALSAKKGKTGVFVSSFGNKPIDTAATLLSTHKLPLFGFSNKSKIKQPAGTIKKKFLSWKIIAFLGILGGLCELPNIVSPKQQNISAPQRQNTPLVLGISTLAILLAGLKLSAFLLHKNAERLNTKQQKEQTDWTLHLKNMAKHKDLYKELTQSEIDYFFKQLDISSLSPTKQKEFFNFIIKSMRENPLLAKTIRELNSLLTLRCVNKGAQKLIQTENGAEVIFIGEFKHTQEGKSYLKLASDRLLSDTFFHELKHAIQAQNGYLKIPRQDYFIITTFLNEAQCKGYSILADMLYPYNKLLQALYLQEKQKKPTDNKRRILGRAQNKTVGLIMNMLIASDFETFIETEPAIKQARLTETEKNFLRLDVQEWRSCYEFNESFEGTVPPAKSVVQQLSDFFTIDTGYQINAAELWKPKKPITPPHSLPANTGNAMQDKLIQTHSKVLFCRQRT